MEKGSISLDALISMILIISLITWLHALVGSQQDYVGRYGETLQAEFISLQYGSMINNYYALNPDTNLILEQPIIKKFSRELKQTPTVRINKNEVVINAYTSPTYPIAEPLSPSKILVLDK